MAPARAASSAMSEARTRRRCRRPPSMTSPATAEQGRREEDDEEADGPRSPRSSDRPVCSSGSPARAAGGSPRGGTGRRRPAAPRRSPRRRPLPPGSKPGMSTFTSWLPHDHRSPARRRSTAWRAAASASVPDGPGTPPGLPPRRRRRDRSGRRTSVAAPAMKATTTIRTGTSRRVPASRIHARNSRRHRAGVKASTGPAERPRTGRREAGNQGHRPPDTSTEATPPRPGPRPPVRGRSGRRAVRGSRRPLPADVEPGR